MYSPALVTLHNIAGEPGHIAKKLSKKDNSPNYMGQQSCFQFQQNTFYLKFSFKKKSNFKKRPQMGTDPKPQEQCKQLSLHKKHAWYWRKSFQPLFIRNIKKISVISTISLTTYQRRRQKTQLQPLMTQLHIHHGQHQNHTQRQNQMARKEKPTLSLVQLSATHARKPRKN